MISGISKYRSDTNAYNTLVCAGLFLNMQMHYEIQQMQPLSIQEIQAVQNRANRFVKNNKGQHDITVGRTTLKQRELS